MRIVVIGLGSMGKRRIRLIKKFFNNSIDIYGIDSNKNRITESQEKFGIIPCNGIETASRIGCECAFVCTSPLSHFSIICECLRQGMHVFTELNVVADGYDEMISLSKINNKVLFLSSTFLYRTEIQYIIEKTRSVNTKTNYFYHVGQYLPDWHPWEKINDFFVFDKRTNGCREILVRELPWIIEAFGEIKHIKVLKNKISSLELSYDDSYCILFEHTNGSCGTVLIDVVSRKPNINLELINENFYVSWNGTPTGLYEFDLNSKKEIQICLYKDYEHEEGYSKNIIEDAYLSEIDAFFKQVSNGILPIYNFEKDKKTLLVMDEIEGIINE